MESKFMNCVEQLEPSIKKELQLTSYLEIGLKAYLHTVIEDDDVVLEKKIQNGFFQSSLEMI